MEKKNLLDTLRAQQYISILNSQEYRELVSIAVKSIKQRAVESDNEATIEFYFEAELFSFFKYVFEPLGFSYHPQKEVPVATRRHVSKGRADSAIGSLVIEFKHNSKLSSQTDIDSAITQISEYLLGLYETEKTFGLGVITDGLKICYIQQTRR